MDERQLAKVTEGQRACLRLVLRHMSSKEIARALDISRHTVDQRLRLAMRTLGAASRVEAAQILAGAEGGEGYQGLIHQPPDIDSGPARPPSGATAPPEMRRHGNLPRIGWIAAIAAAAAIALAALFVGLNALSQFTR
jgi:DNA-binding CsgD family transcriptional regulator